MRCKTCHYTLENLTEHRCPECGRAFDPNNPFTFDDSADQAIRILWAVAIALIVLGLTMPGWFRWLF